MKDLNNTLMHGLMKEVLFPTEVIDYGRTKHSTFFKMAKNFMKNIIMVRLRYKSSQVETNKLEVRTTTTDKIANFGGTFGIWAELTGCSLLGFINLLIISFKLLFRSQN